MGKGILKAVTIVFPDVPDFICHFHFLRDIGKDLLDPNYDVIRKQLKTKKLRGQWQDNIPYFKVCHDLKHIMKNKRLWNAVEQIVVQ